MNFYTDVLKNHYFDFEGKATRQQFWMFALINFLISLVLSMTGTALEISLMTTLANVYSLLILIPSLGIAVRRLHDINKSGWWLLIGLIPILGWIVLLIFYVTPSKK